MHEENSSIFIFKNRALGDAIISLGCIQYLKQYLPQAKIFYGVPQWVFPLFSQLNTVAFEIIPVDLRSLSGWRQTYMHVKRLSPNLIFELFQTGRGKKFGSLFQLLNKNSSYLANNHHLNDESYKKPNIQRDIDGLRSKLKDMPHGSYLDFTPKLSLISPVRKLNKIILGIVATRETKLWPIENYHGLATLLTQRYRDLTIQIPISANTLDQSLKSRFMSLGNIDRVDFLETSLMNLPSEVAKGKLYIGNDTGIKHLAIALGLESISFFGPEPPIEWHPYDKKKHPYYYQEGLECRTRDAHFCGLNTCESMICLNQISPEKVFNESMKKIEELLC